MEVRNVNEVPAFITKDSSEIREIMAYRNSGIAAQSLAQATVYPGQSTEEHYHPRTEEIYYIEKGRGRIRVNGESRDIGPGDAIGMLPGDVHKIWNTGEEPLQFLCCCTPPYEHEDTVMTEGETQS
ncbi:MAG: cupin domain-containing protein [Clostridia bacterium]|nr:cupin domain-containing protein [Clostridia bacterium]